MTQQRTALPSTASPLARTRALRTFDLLILSIGTFALGVDGFVLSGLLPQVAASAAQASSTRSPLCNSGRVTAAVRSACGPTSRRWSLRSHSPCKSAIQDLAASRFRQSAGRIFINISRILNSQFTPYLYIKFL